MNNNTLPTNSFKTLSSNLKSALNFLNRGTNILAKGRSQ